VVPPRTAESAALMSMDSFN